MSLNEAYRLAEYYGNLARVAIGFAISTGNRAELDAADVYAREAGHYARIVCNGPAFVDVSTITEYGLTQKLSNAIRVF